MTSLYANGDIVVYLEDNQFLLADGTSPDFTNLTELERQVLAHRLRYWASKVEGPKVNPDFFKKHDASTLVPRNQPLLAATPTDAGSYTSTAMTSKIGFTQ